MSSVQIPREQSGKEVAIQVAVIYGVTLAFLVGIELAFTSAKALKKRLSKKPQ